MPSASRKSTPRPAPSSYAPISRAPQAMRGEPRASVQGGSRLAGGPLSTTAEPAIGGQVGARPPG